mgnify:CR=1 FL=1
MVGTLQILQVQIISNARRAVGGIEGLGFFIGAVVGGLAGQVNFADVVIREARRLQQGVFELGVRNFTVAVRVRLGMDREIAVRTGGVWKRTELRRASDGGADSAAISPVPPCASVRADRMWICRIGIDSKFSSVYLRFISIFERGARVLSFPINPPKGERSRPFRRMDRAFRK